MKILSSENIRKADAYTIKHEPVKSIDLMERAAAGCVNWIISKFDKKNSFSVFCGPGNNGGDGLAIARMLSEKGYEVEVFILKLSEKFSEDFSINLKRLNDFKKIKIHTVSGDNPHPPMADRNPKSVLIDALFGSGLTRPPEGIAAETISFINDSKLPVISIDIPSGLFCDQTSVANKEKIVRAAYTLTFELPKMAFMFHENASCVGEFHLIPIRLDKKFVEESITKNFFTDEYLAKSFYRKRKKFSHKGTYGHALLIAGSYGKMGAAVLSSKACLRSGAGLLTSHVPKCGVNILQTAVPEAMADADVSEFHFSEIKNTDSYHAIGIGPGIGTENPTQNALKLIIQNSGVPLVLDADALNILAENKTWLSFLPQGSILTPHAKEFEWLAGKSSDDFERHQMQVNFAVKHRVYLILKGAHSCIACPDGKSYFNSTGNPGMATAGSGDVLTGILTALLAQGYKPLEACILGVYLHGLAGDFAAKKNSEEAIIAGDIVENLGNAFVAIQQKFMK